MTSNHWQVQDAKQRFSELVRRAQDEGVQVVTRHGQEVAVVLGMAEFRQLSDDRPDFKAYLIAGPVVDVEVVRSPELPRELDTTGME